MAQSDHLSNGQRTVVLVLNLVTAYAVYVWFVGSWQPLGDIKSVWLLCAASFWMLTLLSAPWFVPPRDAIVSAIGVLLILATMDFGSVQEIRTEIDLLRWFGVAYAVGVILIAVYALVLFDTQAGSRQATAAFRLVGVVGAAVPLFSVPALVSIAAGYQEQTSTPIFLSLIWILLVIARPIELVAKVVSWWWAVRDANEAGSVVGEVDRIDYPNIIRVRMNSGVKWVPNQLYTAALPDGSQHYVISLFDQLQGANVVGTGLMVSGNSSEQIDLKEGSVCAAHDADRAAEIIAGISGTSGSQMVGFVVEGSTIESIRFEVSAASALQEGELVFANVRGKEVFYQIVDAETSEESFHSNPRGTHIAVATQVGVYTASDGFTKFPWLPGMNTAMFSAASRSLPPVDLGDRDFEFAEVPSTNISFAANADDLIDYHSAVLGVTGTGKTELALSLIRSVLEKGTKVFCVDLTGEYRYRLAEFSPEFPSISDKSIQAFEEKLFNADSGGNRGAPEQELKKFIEKMKTPVSERVAKFLEDDEKTLAILELSEIANTKATLRITEAFLFEIISWARKNRGRERILIVLEEAHTIIPETAGSGMDFGSQRVVSRIGQIALQGRKYQVGLMVVSQRTALVSKTILSQCNTFFTHALIDQTSLGFLENVYSRQHSRLIPRLKPLQFLAYGKALKSDRPILLQQKYDEKKLAATEQMKIDMAKAAEEAEVKAVAEGNADDKSDAKVETGVSEQTSPP